MWLKAHARKKRKTIKYSHHLLSELTQDLKVKATTIKQFLVSLLHAVPLLAGLASSSTDIPFSNPHIVSVLRLLRTCDVETHMLLDTESLLRELHNKLNAAANTAFTATGVPWVAMLSYLLMFVSLFFKRACFKPK